MLNFVHCAYCGGHRIDLDAISVNVELRKAHACTKCHKTAEETTLYFFCSESCFYAYLKNVAKEKADFSFNKGHKPIEVVE